MRLGRGGLGSRLQHTSGPYQLVQLVGQALSAVGQKLQVGLQPASGVHVPADLPSRPFRRLVQPRNAGFRRTGGGVEFGDRICSTPPYELACARLYMVA